VIDVAWTEGKTFVELKRLSRDRIASGNGPRTRRCKAIGIDEGEEEVL
jgi:hypothetical protein